MMSFADLEFALMFALASISTLAGTGIALYALLAAYLIITRRTPALSRRFLGIIGLNEPDPAPGADGYAGVVPVGKEVA